MLLSLSFPCLIVLGFVFVLLSLSFICVAVIVFAIFVHSLYDCILVLRQADLDHQDLCHQNRVDVCIANNDRGKIKAVCCDLGHCSLLPKSDLNAVYLLPNAVYCLQGSFMRSSILPLLSIAATPPFMPEEKNTSFVLSTLNC